MNDTDNQVCEVCMHWLQLRDNSGKCLFAEKERGSFLYTNKLCSCKEGFKSKYSRVV